MNKLTEEIFKSSPYGYFTSQDTDSILQGSPDSRYGLVKRAIAGGEIIQIRRGLYCLAQKFQKNKINLYALAEHIHGPSYISLESALSWHAWIPEAVYTLTSASFGKSKEFHTPLGLFSYSHVPQKIFFTGVDRHIDETGDVFFMASPIKALADYIHVNKKDWNSLLQCSLDLRIEMEDMQTITIDETEQLIENYTSQRVTKFLKKIRKELKR